MPPLPLAPRARIGCEPLERRDLLSAGAAPLPDPPLPLVAGYADLQPDRVVRSLLAVQQLQEKVLTVETPLAAGTPLGAPGTVAPTTVVADLNQDGVDDTIQWWQPPGSNREILQVVYGATEKTPAVTYQMALEHVVQKVLVGDYDNDGRPDIFAQEGGNGVGMLLLNRGDGAFDAYRQGGRHVTFAVGDLDGDGKPSFVYGEDGMPQYVPYGVLDSLSTVAQAMVLPANEIQLADVNGDGIPDLAVSAGDGSLQLYPGLGGGAFGDPILPLQGLFDGTGPVHAAWVHLANQSSDSAPADSDAQAYMDLVVASPSRSQVAVLLHQEGWDYRVREMIQVGLAPSAVTAADVNGDGIPDLVVTCAGSNSVWVLPGLSGGLFDVRHPVILPTGADPVATYAGHFAEGKGLGLITIDQGSNGMTYYSDPFNPELMAQFIPSGGSAPSSAVVADVNGDGYSDLIVANKDDGRMSLFTGGSGGLQLAQTLDLPGSHPVGVTTGPGLNSPYQVYVLDEDSAEVQVVSFNPVPASTAATDEAGPPSLETPSALTLRLLPVSSRTWEIVPTLVMRLTEPENEGPIFCAANHGGPCKLPECHSPDEEPVPQEPAAANPGDGASPEESGVQRYLLGVDAVPAPALEPTAPPAAPPAASGSMVQANLSPGAVEEEEECGDEAAGEMPRAADAEAATREPARLLIHEESGALAMADVLLGVVILLGPTGLNETRSAARAPAVHAVREAR